jgi:hypothetical protein
MADDRLDLAIGRLERALARVEAASELPVPSTPGPSTEDYADLERRHSALRRRAISTIAELDAIIGHADAGMRT